jgi:hypothetical protein
MSAKIVLCVIRQILLNLTFFNDRQQLALCPVSIGGRGQELTGQNFYSWRLGLLSVGVDKNFLRRV